MRKFTSLVVVLGVAGSILGSASMASAASTLKNHPVDLPTNVSYGEAAAVNATSPQDRYFYYDGKFHVTYPSADASYSKGDNLKVSSFYYDGRHHDSYSLASSGASASRKDADIKPTGSFFYDGRYHDTYVGR